jgi:hypothetical protein
MGYSLELELAIESTDSNKILGRDWRAKHQIFERVKKEIFLKTRGKTPANPLENFTVSVIRQSVKTLDFDNLIASLKPYIDGLKLSGIIQDDSWKYIRNIPVDQEISKDKKLLIRVSEL